MNDLWAKKFQEKLREKELAKQEAGKRFESYHNSVLQLFAKIESKLAAIEEIVTTRKFTAQTSQGPGPWEPIKTLVIKCNEKWLEFIPEGINLDTAHGRIRIRHNSSLGQFVYLHLIIDDQKDCEYPDNLVWVFNENGDSAGFESLPEFTEDKLEQIMEQCFLG